MQTIEHLLTKLEALAATKGKKDKLAIIQTFSGPDLRKVKFALDPTVTFYVAKLAPVTRFGTAQWGDDEWELLTMLSTRTLTGNEALSRINSHMVELCPEDSEVLRRVLIKDLRAGIGASSVNKVFPGTVPEFAYMRCSLPKNSNIDKWDLSGGLISELKADGMFARVGRNEDGVIITTRQGNRFPYDAKGLAKLRCEADWAVPVGHEMHGELTVWKNGVQLHRSEGNGMLNSLLSDGGDLEDGCEVRFDAWDMIPLDAAVPGGSYTQPYHARFGALGKVLAEAGARYIYLIEHRWVDNLDEARAHYKEMLDRGLEGTVLKHPNAIWFDGDSKDQVKFKLEVDVDLKIVGFKEGTPGTRTAETFGSVLVETSDGKLASAVSGMKRDIEMWLHQNREAAIGMIMTVRANDVSPPCETNELYALYHPRFVELRKDKVEADSLEQVLDQFEAATA